MVSSQGDKGFLGECSSKVNELNFSMQGIQSFSLLINVLIVFKQLLFILCVNKIIFKKCI